MKVDFIKRGDFFELVGPEAMAVAKALGVAWANDRSGNPMVGIPCWNAAPCREDLIAAGFEPHFPEL